MRMNRRLAPLAATSALILVVLFGCKRGDGTDGLRLDTLSSDRDKLLLIQKLPLGLTYHEAKQRLPSLGLLKPEGGMEPGDTGLEEAWGEMMVLNRKASLECNFNAGRLYSYYFSVESLDDAGARSLYRELQRFYTMQYGNYHEEHENDEGRLMSSSLWSSDSFGIVATLSGSDGEFEVSWGFQPLPPVPEDEPPLASMSASGMEDRP